MIHKSHSLLIVTTFSMMTSLAAFAQEPADPPDPFGGDAKPAAPAAKPAAKPAEPEKVETDPNVLAIRSQNPRTPMELMGAIEKLINLGRPDEAKKFLKTLADSRPDETTLWSLQRKYGSAIFLRMSMEEGMKPEGPPFAQSVLSAAHKMVREPARLDALIKQLSSPTPESRHAALVDLRDAAEDAVIVLLAVLADNSRAAEHEVVRVALTDFRAVAEPPMLASLDSGDDALRQNVLKTFGMLQTRTVIPYLLQPALTGDANSPLRQLARASLVELTGSVPTQAEAERFLFRRATSFFEGELAGKPDHEDLLKVWRWDATAKRPIVERKSRNVASLQMAVRLSGELVRLVPQNREYETLYLTAALQSAKLQLGWEQPFAPKDLAALGLAAQPDADALEDVIRFALSHHRPAAAVAALELIGATGDIRFLFGTAGRPRAVGEALQNSDRRVSFAALQAIRKIDPHESFPGASFVPEMLGYFARGSGTRRALIAHPSMEQAQSLVGLFRELGIDAEAATQGAVAIQLAKHNPDYEFVCMSDSLDRPNVKELFQQFRHEPRTAKLPIAILSREENFARLTMITESDRVAGTFPRPHDVAGVSFLFGRLMQRVGDDFVEGDERLKQAEEALDYLISMAEKPQVYGFMDLISQQAAIERALHIPRLSGRAARALGLLATADAQRTLVTLASQNERQLAERQAAATAFSQAIQRRGLLLTRGEVLMQYDRYNASATLDEETQRVLGAVLDSIESRSQPESEKQP